MISDRAAGRLIAIAAIVVGAMTALATEPLPTPSNAEFNGLTKIAPSEAQQPDLASLATQRFGD